MPKNHWYAIESSRNLKKRGLISIERFGQKLLLFRDADGKPACLEDRCPHRQLPLSLGKVKEGCIECPAHGFRFKSTGTCTLVPANGKDGKIPKDFFAKSYVINEIHDIIWIWWGDAKPASPIPWFDEVVGFDYVESCSSYPLGFCRFMEANVDFAHFYFVHKYIKIPGNGPRAKKIHAETRGNRIEICGEFGDEQAKPGATKGEFTGTLHFPGIALYDSAIRTLVASSPISENCTWFTLRIYLKPSRWQFFKKLFLKYIFFGIILRIIFREDQRLLKHQQGLSGLEGDKLVSKADEPFVHYLRLWQKHLNMQKDVIKPSEQNPQERSVDSL